MDHSREKLIHLILSDFFIFQEFFFRDPEFHEFYNEFENGPIHEYLIRHVYGAKKGEKYAIAAPRGHGKTTTLVEQYACWLILRGDIRYGIWISDSQEQSIERLSAIHDFFELHFKLHELFDIKITKGIKSFFVTVDGRKSKCASVGRRQKVRGRKMGKYRPSAFIDDAEGDSMTSATEREQMRRFIDAAVIPAIDDGFIIMVGTIVDEYSYLNKIVGNKAYNEDGTLKASASGWKRLFMQWVLQDTEPGEFAAEGHEVIDPETKQPSVIWHSKKPYSMYKEKLDECGEDILKRALFFQEMQNIAATDEFREFPSKDIHSWKCVDGESLTNGFYFKEFAGQRIPFLRYIGMDNEPHDDPVNIYVAMDPASTDKSVATRKTAYSAIVVAAVTPDGTIRTVDYFRQQVNTTISGKMFIHMCYQYRPIAVRMEITGFQALYDHLKTYRYPENPDIERYASTLHIQPMRAVAEKHQRIRSLQPMVSGKRLLLHENHKEIRTEMLEYREHGGPAKDLLDVLYWICQQVSAPKPFEQMMEIKRLKTVSRIDPQTGMVVREKVRIPPKVTIAQ